MTVPTADLARPQPAESFKQAVGKQTYTLIELAEMLSLPYRTVADDADRDLIPGKLRFGRRSCSSGKPTTGCSL